MHVTLLSLCLLALSASVALAQQVPLVDTVPAAGGPLRITFVGHGTLMFEFGGRVIHVDPWSKLADYAQLPRADLILITHSHQDHLDPKAVRQASKEGTVVVVAPSCPRESVAWQVMTNGDSRTEAGIGIEAVPAYNLVHKRPDGNPFHPKGEGNGYVLTFGDKRVYVAGDTEPIPEMAALKAIDVAFLPMNLPYTMTPQMVADAAKALRPGILYPYHYGETDPALLTALLADEGIDVRVRPMR